MCCIALNRITRSFCARPEQRLLFFHIPALEAIEMKVRYIFALGLVISLGLASSDMQASAKKAGDPAPGFYRITVGEVEVTVLSDGTVPLPMDHLLTNTTPEFVDQELAASFIKEPYATSVNCFLLNFGSRLVLIDTGAGLTLGPTLNHLMANLRASGYEPDQVDDIFLTHMHIDHEGGLTSSGVPAFPNAVLHADDREANYWLNQENEKRASDNASRHPSDEQAKFVENNFVETRKAIQPYIDAAHFKWFHGGEEVLPGLLAISAPGHTPGHTMFSLVSDDSRILFWGDIVHVAEVQLARPQTTIMFDSDSTRARVERLKVLKEVASQGELIAGSHLPFPGLGYLRRSQQAFTFLPLHFGEPSNNK
jgi:glyoxylase-like metal-dependent hydrolase (beta-lactamase superfamily II)